LTPTLCGSKLKAFFNSLSPSKETFSSITISFGNGINCFWLCVPEFLALSAHARFC
jgi:hypothetical protein